MKPSSSIFISWEQLLPHLHDKIQEAAPEIKGKRLPTIIRGRRNGFWLEFFKDEASLRRRQMQKTLDGPEILAGELDFT